LNSLGSFVTLLVAFLALLLSLEGRLVLQETYEQKWEADVADEPRSGSQEVFGEFRTEEPTQSNLSLQPSLFLTFSSIASMGFHTVFPHQ